jgi:hypothetical protein
VVGELGRIAQRGDRLLHELEPLDQSKPDDRIAGELDRDRPVASGPAALQSNCGNGCRTRSRSIAVGIYVKSSSAAPGVPIIFIGISEPVAVGFVGSLAHLGGNITGFSKSSAAHTTIC